MATSVVSRARERSAVIARRSRTRVSDHPVLVVGLVLIAAQLAFRGWAVYHSWFQFDDFAFISRMLNEGLSVSSLMEPYAGHVMPGGFLLSWVNATIDPLNWALPATELLVMQGAASLGCLLLLRSAFGERAGILPLLVLYLTSVITIPAFVWWAAGVNQMPLQIVFFFGTVAHLRYLRTRQVRYAVTVVVLTLLGLLFYEKVLLLLGVWAILTFAYFTTGDTASRLKASWRDYRPAVLLYGLTGVGYLVFYSLYGLNFDPNSANDHPLAPVATRLVGQAFGSGIVGGPFRWEFPNQIFAIASPTDLTVALAWVGIAALTVHIARVRSRSKRAWTIAGFLLAADVLLVAAGRASFVGPTIALDYRYQSEMSAIVALALGLATLPLLGARESAEETKPSPFLDNRDRVTALTAVVALAATYSSMLYIDHWHSATQSRTYFTNVEHDLTASSEPVPLVDQPVPDFIMWSFNYPESAYSHVLRMFEDDTRYPTVVSDELFTIADSGHVRPAVITAVRQALPGPVDGCGYRLGATPTTVPLNGPVVGGGWWLRIGYFAKRPSPVTIEAGDVTARTRFEAGLHSLYLEVAGTFNSFTISGLKNGSRACTSDINLGLPVPYEGP